MRLSFDHLRSATSTRARPPWTYQLSPRPAPTSTPSRFFDDKTSPWHTRSTRWHSHSTSWRRRCRRKCQCRKSPRCRFPRWARCLSCPRCSNSRDSPQRLTLPHPLVHPRKDTLFLRKSALEPTRPYYPTNNSLNSSSSISSNIFSSSKTTALRLTGCPPNPRPRHRFTRRPLHHRATPTPRPFIPPSMARPMETALRRPPLRCRHRRRRLR